MPLTDKIAVAYHQEHTIHEILIRGFSFRMCAAEETWPPLQTLNAFLQNGIDDLEDNECLTWEPFTITQDDYFGFLGPNAAAMVKPLDASPGDWHAWFNALAIMRADRIG